MDKLLLYPCDKVILLNSSDKKGTFVNPLYNTDQLGLGNIPENGLDLILVLDWFNRFTFFGSCPVYAAIKAGINTSCAYLP